TDQSSAGIDGKTITFSCTGAAGLSSVTTNPDCTFSVTAVSPNTVTLTLHDALPISGDSSYSTSSASRSYNTLIHSTSLTLTISPQPVGTSSTYSVSGKLKDTTTGTYLGAMTISFSADPPITISSTSTNSTGNYLVSGLVSPSTTGSYNTKA